VMSYHYWAILNWIFHLKIIDDKPDLGWIDALGGYDLSLSSSVIDSFDSTLRRFQSLWNVPQSMINYVPCEGQPLNLLNLLFEE
jgi:hypothetical protein